MHYVCKADPSFLVVVATLQNPFFRQVVQVSTDPLINIFMAGDAMEPFMLALHHWNHDVGIVILISLFYSNHG